MAWDKYDAIRFEEGEYAYSRAVERHRRDRKYPETQAEAKARRDREEQNVRDSVNCGPWGDGE